MAGQEITYFFIVARSRNFVIGCDNKLPWHLPSDLKIFKNLTMGHPIIMGRRTFDSIGRALPGRTNIVISRENGIHEKGVDVVRTKADAMELAEADAHRRGVQEVMVIGGAEIFDLFHNEVGGVFLTEVDVDIDRNGSAKFERSFSEWSLRHRVAYKKGQRHPGDEYGFTISVFCKPNIARCVQAQIFEAA